MVGQSTVSNNAHNPCHEVCSWCFATVTSKIGHMHCRPAHGELKIDDGAQPCQQYKVWTPYPWTTSASNDDSDGQWHVTTVTGCDTDCA